MTIADPVPPLQPPVPSNQPPQPQQAAPAGPEDRWTALRAIGFWKPMDYILLILWIGVFITAGFWKLFGDPTSLNLLCLIGASMGIIQVWGLIIGFRCMDFVLQSRARMEMLPYEAGRIAVGYMQGGQELKK